MILSIYGDLKTATLFQLVKMGTTRLGSDPVRFFEFGTAPELESLPYATWQELSGEPVNYIYGAPDSDIVTIQIDVWAETAAEVRDIARDIRLALAPAGQFTFYQNTWDEESRLYRCILHFIHKQDV